jgi:hypothetical protein
MVGNKIDSDDIELLTLDGDSLDAEQVEMPEMAEMPETPPETIHVPVENLGAGLVNALGDMVGGMIGLKKSTTISVKKGVQAVKDQVAQSITKDEIPEEPVVDTEVVVDAEDDTKQG